MSSASTGCIAMARPELLFTENESNASRLWGQPNASPYVKDAFHAYVISGNREAVNPAKVGTKAAAHYVLEVPGGGSQTVRLRLRRDATGDAFGGFAAGLARRVADADEFYDHITPESLDEDQRRVHRQALAGMLWSKQVLPLRPGALAEGAPQSSSGGIASCRRAQH